MEMERWTSGAWRAYVKADAEDDTRTIDRLFAPDAITHSRTPASGVTSKGVRWTTIIQYGTAFALHHETLRSRSTSIVDPSTVFCPAASHTRRR